MAGYEGHRGWINYLAVSPEHRRKGYGRQIMAEAERLLRAAGCPKINLQIRSPNKDVIAFYRSIGFAVDDVVSMGRRLDADTQKLWQHLPRHWLRRSPVVLLIADAIGHGSVDARDVSMREGI